MLATDTTAWEDAIAGFEADDRSNIIRAAGFFEAADGAGRHIVPNLKMEHFLPASEMQSLQRLLLSADWSNPLKVLDDYRELCYTLVQSGGPVRTSPPPRLIGRAVEEEAFCYQVFQASGKRTPLKAIVGLIQRFVTGSASKKDRDALSLLPMSPFAAWVTWQSETGGDDDPFSEEQRADDIRASLGLSIHGLGRPILLMVYPSAEAPQLIRPTCADAGLYLRFRPPPMGFEDHGLTKPWEDTLNKKYAISRPKPEGIHGRVNFPSITFSRRSNKRK